jgi:Ubiquinol-cytochrome C reductase, UQCRX/QCR9 like
MIYNLILKNNITFATAIFVAAIIANSIFESVTDGVWRSVNKGKQFQDMIKLPAYQGLPESVDIGGDDEDEDDDDDDDDDDEDDE